MSGREGRALPVPWGPCRWPPRPRRPPLTVEGKGKLEPLRETPRPLPTLLRCFAFLFVCRRSPHSLGHWWERKVPLPAGGRVSGAPCTPEPSQRALNNWKADVLWSMPWSSTWRPGLCWVHCSLDSVFKRALHSRSHFPHFMGEKHGGTE